MPFSKGSILADIRQDGVIHSEEYTPDGTLIDEKVDIIYLENFDVQSKQKVKLTPFEDGIESIVVKTDWFENK